MPHRLLIIAFALALFAAGSAGTASAAAGDVSPKLSITMVARVCPTYADVYANRSRNNLMESLRNLGGDTRYTAGQEVLPTREDVGTQAACTPLTGWQFKLGTGYRSRADVGTWGTLSKVTSPYAQTIETKASVPLPNVMGGSTGMSIAGAVTVELTDAQAKLAASGSKLWVQGGVPGDPLLTSTFGSKYGFAALRCAVDNLNGDNVEWVQVPTGHTDVFCYAYLVDQTPQSGTITIVKRVQSHDGSTSVQQAASFSGSVSYNPGGQFSVAATSSAPGSIDFTRDAVAAGGTPWSVVELPQGGWRLADVACVSATGASRVASQTVNSATQAGAAQITLAGGDRVTCTFTNVTVAPPPSTLTLTKTTVGGIGTFPITVTGGGGFAQTAKIATAEAGVAGAPVNISVPTAGVVHVVEDAPISGLGTWKLTDLTCNGQRVAITDGSEFDVSVPAGAGVACSLTNEFTPNGAITVRKETIGGKGAAGFVVSAVGDPTFERTVSAQTTQAGPAGTQVASGDRLTQIPLGAYVISETGDAFVGTDEWLLESVVCDDVPVATAGGKATIVLTPANPRVDCTFTNKLIDPSVGPFIPLTPAGTPISPTPSGPGSPTTPITALGRSTPLMAPITDVSIRVRAQPRLSEVGHAVAYSAVVRNNGPYAARGVTATFAAAQAATPTSIRPSQGSCRPSHGMIVCTLGTLMRGSVVTFSGMRTVNRPGAYVLKGVVSTSTEETTMRNNTSRASFRVIDPEPVTG